MQSATSRYRQSTPGRLSGRRARVVLLAVIAALVVVVLAVLVAALWPDDPAEPRAREYRDVTVCLLTGAAGVTDPAAAPVWAGMQESSLTETDDAALRQRVRELVDAAVGAPAGD